MQLSLPAMQKILDHSSTKHHEISDSFAKQIKKTKKIMLCQGLEILGSKMTIVGKKKYFSNATKRKQQ